MPVPSGDRVHYFGIRHHGPGSARRVLQSLEELNPVCVLVEGPADGSDAIPNLTDAGMIPPIALLCYAADDPTQAAFWPFTTYSPEYQAIHWALRHGREVRFIDIPSHWDFTGGDDIEIETAPTQAKGDHTQHVTGRIIQDPIGVLAEVAGYEDGESWWTNVIEENPAAGPVFPAIAQAMAELRRGIELPRREARREAHMRLEIHEAQARLQGPIAVVCGAWHVPGLMEHHSLNEDRALLKRHQSSKTVATWTSWTSPRLSKSHGYGAGLKYPNWNRHLWTCGTDPKANTLWFAQITQLLRDRGHLVSTASVIEAERLAFALASVRNRPTVGFAEMQDAAISCLLYGNVVPWQEIAEELLIGNEIGTVPDSIVRSPLQADLDKQLNKARLKREALEKKISLDLRTGAGLFRSQLLHRLSILEIPFGVAAGVGSSRGTFRENWVICWQPEFDITLIKKLSYGATLSKAASGYLAQCMRESNSLADISELVSESLTAGLEEAVTYGLSILEKRIALSDDCLDILHTLPPLSESIRYGQAREIQLDALPELLDRLVTSLSISLRYAVRNLDEESSIAFSKAIRTAHQALKLTEDGSAINRNWRNGLLDSFADQSCSRFVAGTLLQLLYAEEDLLPADIITAFSRHLSPGTPLKEAAAFFQGYFETSAQQLIYDQPLARIVSDWLLELDEVSFIETLPVLRRVFSPLDPTERRRLLDSVLKISPASEEETKLPEQLSGFWDSQVGMLSADLFKR